MEQVNSILAKHLYSYRPRQADSSLGFSIVEIVLAIVIGSLALAGTISAFSSHLVAGKRASDRTIVEEAIARDTGWIRNYAKIWKMQSGPYNLTNAQTYTTDSFASSPYISYSPDSGGSSCSTGLAASFLADAETVTGLTPARPFSLQSSSISLSKTITGVSLSRAISYTNPYNTITITYSLSGGAPASSLGISRQTSVYIEAAAWCPS